MIVTSKVVWYVEVGANITADKILGQGSFPSISSLS